jgi:hypothetical protein
MLGFEPRDIEVTPAGLWVIGQSEVAQLDPGTGTILRQLPGSANANIGTGASGLWAMTTVNARLHLLDITNGSDIAWVDIDPTEITNEGTTAVTEALGSTWVVRYGSPALVRIGPP